MLATRLYPLRALRVFFTGLATMLALLCCAPVAAANRGDALSFIQHEVRNHEQQINAMSQRIESYESGWDIIREQVEALRSSYDHVKRSAESSCKNAFDTESLQKNVHSDLKQLHANQEQLRDALAQLQKQQQEQKLVIDAMKQAMTALTELLQGEAEAVKPGKIYKVKSGDTLEKIAKQEKTSLSQIKQLNNMSSDKIVVGQKLKLP
jgi:LysM repeat protein